MSEEEKKSKENAIAKPLPTTPTKTSESVVNVIVIGDSQVGKTCLINRFVRGEFQESTNMTMNMGIIIKKCN